MTKHSISILALLCALAVPCSADDYKGSTPKDGESYRLYNVGTGKFLSATGGVLTLGGAELTVTLTKTTDGYYTLSTADGNIGSALWGAPHSDGSGKYSQWRFRKVKGSDNVYTLANRNREASAAFSIYQDETTGALALEPAQPGQQFSLAQWKLVSSKDDDVKVVTLDENATSYTVPEDKNVTVKLKRTLTAGKWTLICLPFDVTREQIDEQFGKNTQVADFTGAGEEYVEFTTITGGMQKGVAYLVKPERVAANATYTFEGVNSFAEERVTSNKGDVTIDGSFATRMMNKGEYTIIDDAFVRFPAPVMLKGFSGWFSDDYQTSKVWTYSIDGTVGISAVNADGTATGSIYNTAGQKIKTHADGKENLPKGIYIINGKKQTK